MPMVSTERAEEIVTGWLTSTEPFDGIEHPAGPLYLSAYAEYDIQMTGTGPFPPPFTDGMNCCLCTGSATIHCC